MGMTARLRLLIAALLCIALPAASPTWAQTWPQKAVRIIVPFPAGGSNDALCRILADKLSGDWKQPVIVDNKAGAGGNIGAEIAYSAPADGYTLLCSPPGPLSINHNLYKSLPYDWSKFAPHHDPGAVAQRHHRAQGPAGQHRAGIHRLGQGQSRQGDLCQPGQRLDLAPVGADAGDPGRAFAGARPL